MAPSCSYTVPTVSMMNQLFLYYSLFLWRLNCPYTVPTVLPLFVLAPTVPTLPLHCPKNCFHCSYTVPILFLYSSYTVPILFLYSSYTVSILFLYCPYTVPIPFIYCLYCPYTVPIPYLYCSYTVHTGPRLNVWSLLFYCSSPVHPVPTVPTVYTRSLNQRTLSISLGGGAGGGDD